MNGKILGYKLIKLFPNCPCDLGATILISPSGNNQHLCVWPEFWEPIYEEQKKVNLEAILETCYNTIRHTTLAKPEVLSMMRAAANRTIEFIADTTFAHDETKNDFIKKYKALIK